MGAGHRGANFIGTFPGVVATNLLDHGTFQKWLAPYLTRGMKKVGLEPEECGRHHATIISSPNAARRPATFFSVDQKGGVGHNVALEGRFTNKLAYDEAFRNWT